MTAAPPKGAMSPHRNTAVCRFYIAGRGCRSGGAPCLTAAKIISGFRPKNLAAAGPCIITAPRANARNAPPGRCFLESV